MTDNERRHFDKLYNRIIEFNSNKKIKNKAVLRLLDLISYLFKTTKYEVHHENGSGTYRVTFDITVEDDKPEIFIMNHFIGYGHDNTSVMVEIRSDAKASYFNGYYNRHSSNHIFVGNRTRRNLLANVKRMFDTLSDQIKCEMYLNGLRINYDLTD